MRIGTRGSALALAQAGHVAELLGAGELVEISTPGDDASAPSAERPPAGDKSRWVSGLERALAAGEIDLAVHSAKDLPGELGDGLELLGAPPRAAPEDVLCGVAGLDDLVEGARVGTSSARRHAQLRAARADLDVVTVRGNVDTRLRKLADPAEELDAIVIARAGLERLGRLDAVGCVLDPERFVPAPGQGALALQARRGDRAVRAAVAAIVDAGTSACLLAERAVAGGLGADCDSALGAHAAFVGRQLRLRAWLGLAGGGGWIADELTADSGGPAGARPRGRAADRAGAGLSGRVYLVGAGPGDPGLLTVRALELIAEADVILHDRLIPAGALEGASAAAEVIYVGKEGGGESVPQEETQALMIDRALGGASVVRLKGGDPFVFGRGGEEALALRAAGVPFEVVPGVTAGIAAGAYAGIPVTQRGLSSAVALITGHEDPDKQDTAIDWEALARFPGTLVFYMGVRRLPVIAASLIAAGRRADESAAVIQEGTLPGQRTVTGPLAAIAEVADRERIRAPSITIVGPVAALAAQLAWIVPGPLTGRSVAVTRARAQASGLARALRGLGAHVLEAPVIRIRPLPGEPLDPTGYDLVCLASPNAVAGMFERLQAGGRDARALAGARVAAIGPGTEAALAARGVRADVVAERAVAEGLVAALEGLPVSRALVVRAQRARELLPDALRERGAEVDVLPVYETVPEPITEESLEDARAADYITFTSSSTVAFFLDAVGGQAGPRGGLAPTTRVVSIGPATSATLRDRGLEPDVEADRHDVDGVIEALLADARAHPQA